MVVLGLFAFDCDVAADELGGVGDDDFDLVVDSPQRGVLDDIYTTGKCTCS